jgi:hypothetical protein
MALLGHIHWYQSRADLFWPVGPFNRAGIFIKSMGARNQGGIVLSYWPARLHRLAEFIPWNQCQGPINI